MPLKYSYWLINRIQAMIVDADPSTHGRELLAVL